jgi:hypothetical protein
VALLSPPLAFGIVSVSGHILKFLWQILVYNIILNVAVLVLDSLTYVASAVLLWMVRGDYNVADTEKEYETPYDQFRRMTVDGGRYLRSSFFGILVFLKASAALTYGAADVLNVSLSEQVDDGINDSSQRLGILFSVAGVGCLLGPLMTEPWVNMDRPESLQLSCIVSFGVVAVGFYGWGLFHSFWSLCLFACIRSAGSSVLWINSSLLLQKFSEPELLGRVMAVDYALALLTESLSAFICGVLQDHLGLTVDEVSLVEAIGATLLMILWGWYHYAGGGAAGYHEKHAEEEETSPDSGSSQKDSSLAVETSALLPGVYCLLPNAMDGQAFG